LVADSIRSERGTSCGTALGVMATVCMVVCSFRAVVR
jgi:hypothetical protein